MVDIVFQKARIGVRLFSLLFCQLKGLFSFFLSFFLQNSLLKGLLSVRFYG